MGITAIFTEDMGFYLVPEDKSDEVSRSIVSSQSIDEPSVNIDKSSEIQDTTLPVLPKPRKSLLARVFDR